MISTIKLISAGVSTVGNIYKNINNFKKFLGTIKTLLDNCSIHLFYRDNIGNIIELFWKKVFKNILKFYY